MKNQITIILSYLLTTFIYAQSPNFEWVNQTNFEDIFISLSAVDTNSNLYEYGNFENIIDFDPSSVTTNLTSEGSFDIYIRKFDEKGNFLWAKQIGGLDRESIGAISLDSNNNIILTGVFSGALDFDPGPGVVKIGSNTKSAAFVLKLDTDGNFMWVKHIEIDLEDTFGEGIYFFDSIDIDSNDNIYFTGSFEGTFDFDPGQGVHELTSSGGGENMFILKLDVTGSFVWAHKIGDISTVFPSAMVIDKMNNLYISGSFNGTVDFDPGQGTQILTSVGENVFLIKMDSDANLLWANNHGGKGFWSLNVTSITPDSNSNVFMTGFFAETIDFDPGVNEHNLTATSDLNGYVTKLNSNGEFQWVKHFKGGATDVILPEHIISDANNNVYISGLFTGSADFDPNSGTKILSADTSVSIFNQDLFFFKLDINGNLLWAEKLGGGGIEGNLGFSLNSNNDLYVTGFFGSAVDFDYGTGTEILTPKGESDLFILKLSNNGVLSQNDYKDTLFKAYPNPTKDGKITIDLKSVVDRVKILVVDIQGRVLQSSIYNNTSKITLDISNNSVMSSGVYYVKIETVEGQKTIPLLKK